MTGHVETVIQDLKDKNLKSAAQHLTQLQADSAFGSDEWKLNMATINASVDVKSLGLPGANQLLGADAMGNLLTVPEDKLRLQRWNPDGKPDKWAPEMPVFNNLKKQAVEIEKQSAEDRLSKLGPGNHHLTFVSEGKTRDVDVHVPTDYDSSKPLPVVYMLAGANPSTHGLMAAETRGNEISDKEKFIAVYPYALDKPVESPLGFNIGFLQAWNSPTSGLSDYVPGYNDNHMMKDLDKLVSSKLSADGTRKYIFAFSDGANAVNDVAPSMPNTFAAIGSSHGTVWGGETDAKKAGKTAYWGVVSDEGSWIPRLGGAGTFTSGMSRMVTSQPLKQFDNWARADDCKGAPITSKNEDQQVREFTPEQCGGAAVKEINRTWRGSWGLSKGGNGQHAIDGPGEGGFPMNVGAKGSWDSFVDFWNFAKQFKKLPDGTLVHE